MLGEFDLINKFFNKPVTSANIPLSVGDDCALVKFIEGYNLAITTDTLNEGIHFFKDEDPFFIGYKSLLVNLSDLSAMGAEPIFFTLSLTLEQSDEKFLDLFAKGLFSLADKVHIPLIGGNTTKGPFSITISAYGKVKENQALLRSNAQVGDLIFITGSLGGSGLYVKYKNKELSLDDNIVNICHKEGMSMACRCDFASKLYPLSSCAIDISDGIFGDIKHVMEQSRVGALIDCNLIPYALSLQKAKLDEALKQKIALLSGGDYELLFTCRKEHRDQVLALAKACQVDVTCIGEILEKDLGLVVKNAKSKMNFLGYEHF